MTIMEIAVLNAQTGVVRVAHEWAKTGRTWLDVRSNGVRVSLTMQPASDSGYMVARSKG